VAAALALVESEGLDALSMRRLGRELGVEGMALYTYVADKDELLRAVGQLVLADLRLALPGTGSWKERIRATVRAWAEMQERHPRAFPLVYRPDAGEQVARTTEELLDALRTAGLDEAGAALAYQTLVSFLDGALLQWPPVSYRAAEGWAQIAASVDRERYPRTAEIAPYAAGLDRDEVFSTGLELLLDGLEARLADVR
jgi:AcrR family transcriptional regulator